MKKSFRPLFIAIGLFVIFVIAFSEVLLLSSARSNYDKSLAAASLDALREDAGILSSALSADSRANIDSAYNKFLEDLDSFSQNSYVAEHLQDFLTDIKHETAALPRKITTAKKLRIERSAISSYKEKLASEDFNSGSAAENFQKISTDFSEMSQDFSNLDGKTSLELATLSSNISAAASDLAICSAKNTCSEKSLKTAIDNLESNLSTLDNALSKISSDLAAATNINELIKLLEKEVL
jgi:hypothetical protein